MELDEEFYTALVKDSTQKSRQASEMTTNELKFVQMQKYTAYLSLVIPFVAVLGSIYLIAINGVSWFGVSIFIVMYTLTMLGLTMGFHRLFAHKSFVTSPFFRCVLCILGSMTAQGPLLFWVSTHRRHHSHSDKPGDPHSPQMFGNTLIGQLKGLWHVHAKWTITEHGCCLSWMDYVPDLLKDKLMMRMNGLYPLWVLLGILLPGILGGLILGYAYGFLEGVLYGGLVRIFFVYHGYLLNASISHMFGDRPFVAKTKDYSTNNVIAAIIVFGEGNQNNHHAFPRSPLHGLEWHQSDFTFFVMRLLHYFGVIWNYAEIPSRKKMDALRSVSR